MAKDYLMDDDGDILIVDGDLVKGYSDENHIEDLLLSQKGDYKEFPLMGVGLVDYLNGPVSRMEILKMEKEIRMQLQADGASDIQVSYSDTIMVSAKYE